MREIMEAFANPAVQDLAAMCSAQSFKTDTILACLLWAIDQDPGPILWVTKDGKQAVKFARGRLDLALERTAPVAAHLPRKRGHKNTLEIYFPGAPLFVVGAESPGDLQSTPFRYLFLDEVRSYKPGALEMVDKRTRSFPHNYKRFIISTPDTEDDTLHTAYLDGDRRHWLATFPCGHENELLWGDRETKGGLRWDDFRDEDGVRDFERISESVRYHCWHCEAVYAGADIAPDSRFRKSLSSRGRWERRNPHPKPGHVSFHWNALLPYTTDWRKQVIDKIKASARMRQGDFEAMKSHINETEGLPWGEQWRFLKQDKLLRARHAEPTPEYLVGGIPAFNPRAPWPFERQRFATIDVQEKEGRHYYLVIRSWGNGAVSRLLHCDVIWDYKELIARCQEWGVPPSNIAFDAGNYQSEIFAQIMAGPLMDDGDYAMKALWGDDFRREAFTIDGVKHLFTIVPTDPASGTRGSRRMRPIMVWRWAKKLVQDRLAFFMAGGGDSDWRILPESPDNYRQQVTAWERRDVHNGKGERKTEWYKPQRRADHFYSCELEQIVCASATGLLSSPREDLPLFEKRAE